MRKKPAQNWLPEKGWGKSGFKNWGITPPPKKVKNKDTKLHVEIRDKLKRHGAKTGGKKTMQKSPKAEKMGGGEKKGGQRNEHRS